MSLLITHRLQVRFRDCDPLGHVNNAVYLTYLEQARMNLWAAIWGFGRDPDAPIPGVILARAEIDFRAPAVAGDELDVKLSLAGLGRSSFTYEYELVRVRDGQVMASARTVQVLFDYGSNRSVEMSEEVRALLARPVE